METSDRFSDLYLCTVFKIKQIVSIYVKYNNLNCCQTIAIEDIIVKRFLII